MSAFKNEQYEDQKLNTRSLLEAYNQVAQSAHPEFAQEYEQEAIINEEGIEEYTSGALMSTYAQVVDSYREGTIDAEIERSKNDVNRVPRTGYND